MTRTGEATEVSLYQLVNAIACTSERRPSGPRLSRNGRRADQERHIYNVDTNVLTRRLTDDGVKRKVYVDAVQRAVTSFVNTRWLTPKLESAYSQIRSQALADTKKPYTNAEFETDVQGLRGVIAGREADGRPEPVQVNYGTSRRPPPRPSGPALTPAAAKANVRSGGCCSP